MVLHNPAAGPAAAEGRSGGPDSPNSELFGLIRYSHIFGSAVRELLEVKLLEEIGAEHLSLPQLHLLQLITLNGKHQIGQIADFLGVSPPAATKNVDKLEGLGLVARSPCQTDRRATLLTTSRKGRRLVERYEALKLERLGPVLDAFSAEELSQLVRLLERFSVALIQNQDDVEGLCLRCSAHFDPRCPIQHFHHGCPYQKLAEGKRQASQRLEA
ncbi:MAG: MarR family transcriptional regulator [bacterium]|nr:MarR family transcriptional regulator [bacterium]